MLHHLVVGLSAKAKADAQYAIRIIAREPIRNRNLAEHGRKCWLPNGLVIYNMLTSKPLVFQPAVIALQR